MLKSTAPCRVRLLHDFHDIALSPDLWQRLLMSGTEGLLRQVAPGLSGNLPRRGDTPFHLFTFSRSNCGKALITLSRGNRLRKVGMGKKIGPCMCQVQVHFDH